jgi:ribosomal protein S18 acetylase RimI-like enzyme
MEVDHYGWEMEMELEEQPPEPEWPDGITVRCRTEGEGRALFTAEREAFKDHRGHVDEPFEEAFERWTHLFEKHPEGDPSLWFVAEEGEEIAGFSFCMPRSPEDPERGWIQSLGVLRPWRMRGLGLALLLHSFREFHRRGSRRVALGVDAQSLTGATRLYEKAGMRVTGEFAWYEKELRPGREMRRVSYETE